VAEMVDLWFGLICAIGGIITGFFYGRKGIDARLDKIEERIKNGENKLIEAESLSKINVKCPMCGYDFPVAE
jgi:hypothetical protein